MRASHTPNAHRHTPPGRHEHEFEPQYGLPEALPASETLLWQGSPDWKTLAVQRFHVRKLVVYFAVLLVVRVAFLLDDGMPIGAALLGAMTLFSLAALGIGLVALIAWLTARTTVYTLTDQRVVMRIGIVLTIALNLPLKRLQGADLGLLGAGSTSKAGIGDVVLQLQGTDRIAYLQLWPHARGWRFARPEPTLLCVPDAEALAARLTAAWSAATGIAPRAAAAEEPAAQAAFEPRLSTR